MIDVIAMIFVSLFLLSLIVFVFIDAWRMFEQTDLGQLYIEKKREQMEKEECEYATISKVAMWMCYIGGVLMFAGIMLLFMDM